MKKMYLIALILFAAHFSQAQWEDDVRLTHDPFSSQTSHTNNVHEIASSGDSVHIVWYDDRDGNPEIYYKRSVDGGLTWGADTRLTNQIAGSWYPSISLSGSVVHVTWVDQRDADLEIYYKRSTDGGNSWGTDTRFSYNTGASWHPSIALSGEFVHLVWYEYYVGASWEIMYKRSTDQGLTWEESVLLTNDPGNSFNATICLSGQVLHVVWRDKRDGNSEIYYKRSIDGGDSWGEDTRLTNNNGFSNTPCVGISESGLHIVWCDDSDGNYEIYYKRSVDGGLTWGADTRLTNDDAESMQPSLSVSGLALHVAWNDYRDWNYEIYYKRSTDGGLSWEPDIKLTNDFYESKYPFITTSGSKVHVIWQDDRDGNTEIYYKCDPNGNFLVGLENESLIISSGLISVYPNPASRQLTVGQSAVSGQRSAVGGLSRGAPRSQGKLCDEGSAVRLSIVDLYGREIKEFINIASFPYVVDISDLPDGVYFLRVIDEDRKSSSVKFLKITE